MELFERPCGKGGSLGLKEQGQIWLSMRGYVHQKKRKASSPSVSFGSGLTDPLVLLFDGETSFLLCRLCILVETQVQAPTQGHGKSVLMHQVLPVSHVLRAHDQF